MATVNYANGTVIGTTWLNDVDALVWDVFSGATTASLARTALSLGSASLINTPIGVGNGGTGLAVGTSGGIPGYTATTTLASSALLAQYGVMIGGGAGATPTALTAAAAGTVLGGVASANPAFTATPVLGVAGTTAGTLGLSGVTSGVVTVQSAAVAGTWSLTLPPSGGSANQFFQTDGSGVGSWANQGILGTPVTLTTQTSVDFTGIPAGVQRIICMINGLSVSGTSVPIIQLGDSGGMEATGYLGSNSAVNFTTGIALVSSSAATSILHGIIILSLINSTTNTWVAAGTTGLSSTTASYYLGFSKDLDTALTQLRFTTVNGTDQLDAGQINIYYEFQ